MFKRRLRNRRRWITVERLQTITVIVKILVKLFSERIQTSIHRCQKKTSQSLRGSISESRYSAFFTGKDSVGGVANTHKPGIFPGQKPSTKIAVKQLLDLEQLSCNCFFEM